MLSGLIGGAKRVCVIRNALDFSTDEDRLRDGRRQEFQDLAALGLSPSELDLRAYFGAQDCLAEAINGFDALWVVGGNTFVLRQAMRLSGLDAILHKLVRNSEFVYAGYSAGACVLAPTLEGIHLADEPAIVPDGYPAEVLWEGVGLLPFCVAPHYRSDHPESGMIDHAVEYFLHNKMPFIALKDGEVYVADLSIAPNDPLCRIVTKTL
jgi:dipeptidase E